jgi:hypothetical protein
LRITYLTLSNEGEQDEEEEKEKKKTKKKKNDRTEHIDGLCDARHVYAATHAMIMISEKLDETCRS